VPCTPSRCGINPFNARLNAIFGSDIGRFDVPDMIEVLPEASELVDDSLITTDDFRDFTFANALDAGRQARTATHWGPSGPHRSIHASYRIARMHTLDLERLDHLVLTVRDVDHSIEVSTYPAL
jgi:hypothetical protein